MADLDLRSLPADSALSADVCVIGAGPAGLTLATELARSHDVLVVESAGRDPDPETSSLNETESVGATRVADHALVRTRALGGTSRVWEGCCGALDELDYQRRSWVPHSGWPISAAEVAPYLERARPYLGLGPNVYDEQLFDLLRQRRPRRPLGRSVVPYFWQLSRSRTQPGLPTRFDRDVLAGDGKAVRVLSHATVTHINTESNGTVMRSVEASCAGEPRATITAQVFVLCAGGIENARLLLASDRVVPGGVGNGNDLVGRYLTDHPGCVIATIPPALAGPLRDRLGYYWLRGPDGRHVYRGGVALSPDAQREEGLLNCAAYVNPDRASDDPWHAGQRLAWRLRGQPVPELASFSSHESASRAGRQSTIGDVVSVLRHGPSVVAGTYRILRRRRPPLYRARRVDLCCVTEQVPDPASRVTLSDRRDQFGVRMARIDWRLADAELRSVSRLEELFGAALARLGEPRPVAEPWLTEESWQAGMTDRAHPSGTTRMADDPREGVVDRNCAVHGVHGLYIAGSSTFPTSGHVNPTLTIVALSIRLADHLNDHVLRSRAHA